MQVLYELFDQPSISVVQKHKAQEKSNKQFFISNSYTLAAVK